MVAARRKMLPAVPRQVVSPEMLLAVPRQVVLPDMIIDESIRHN